MTPAEVTLAMTALRQAWQYTPMHDIQARQFERLFAKCPPLLVRQVIDDLIQLGSNRPGPAEMGALLRSKAGHSPAGERMRRYGQPIDVVVPESEATPLVEVPDRVAELRLAFSRQSAAEPQELA